MDKNAKKTLFDGKGIVEEKWKIIQKLQMQKKGVEAEQLKWWMKITFQLQLNTQEAIKTFNDLNK